jgi:hypothetical protein
MLYYFLRQKYFRPYSVLKLNTFHIHFICYCPPIHVSKEVYYLRFSSLKLYIHKNESGYCDLRNISAELNRKTVC